MLVTPVSEESDALFETLWARHANGIHMNKQACTHMISKKKRREVMREGGRGEGGKEGGRQAGRHN